MTRTRLRISHIKKIWGQRRSRPALEKLLVDRKPTFDRANVPSELWERLKQIAEPTAIVADRAEAVPTLNAAMRLLGQARKQAATKRQQAKIHSAILRRCEQFQSNIGAVLRSLKRGPLLPSTRVDRALFMDADGRAVLETEAEAVQARVRSHFEAWFGARAVRLEAAPEYIRQEYQPLVHVSSAWFDDLMGPIEPDELEYTLKLLPRGKAPGKSGLANELWAHAGTICREALRLLLNECLRHEDIPTAWKQSMVIPIPKTAEFTGNLDRLRPIALLESSRKVLSAILTRRLQQVLEEHQVLRGLNLGFRANRQAADVAFAI